MITQTREDDIGLFSRIAEDEPYATARGCAVYCADACRF